MQYITTLLLARSIFVLSILSSNTIESNVIHLVSPADGNVCEGGKFTMSSTRKIHRCSHKLPTQIMWYLEGTEISLQLSDYTCEINFTLTVINASSRDAGKYHASYIYNQSLPSAVRKHSSGAVVINVHPCAESTAHNVQTTTGVDVVRDTAKIVASQEGSDVASPNCAECPCWQPLFVGFFVGAAAAVVIGCVLLLWQRKLVAATTFRVIIFWFIKRNQIEAPYEFNSSTGMIEFKPKDMNQASDFTIKLENAGYKRGVDWDWDGFVQMHADSAEACGESTNDSVKSTCVTEVVCGGKSSLLGGTVASGNGKQYGIMVGHAVERGSHCKTKHGKLIGTCVEAIDTFDMTLDSRNITIDIAFVEISEFEAHNVITIRGKTYRLTITREKLKRNSEIFTVCRSGKFRNGIVRDVDTTVRGHPKRHGVITITDFTGKSRISNPGDSGALVMSLPDVDDDKIYVYGILIGHYEDIDHRSVVSMDIAVPLWDTLRAVCQLKNVASLFADDINELDFCRDVNKRTSKQFEIARQTSDKQLMGTTTADKLRPSETHPEVDELVVFSFGEAFAGVRQRIIEEIDTDHGLLQLLRENGLLTAFDLPDISSLGTMSLRAHRLLDILEEYGDATKFELFTEALEATNQRHALENIRLRSTAHAGIANRMLLVLAFRDELETALTRSIFAAFLENLETVGILTNAQVVDCDWSRPDVSHIGPLFDILKRRPDRDFHWFCVALRKTIKWHLNEKILSRIEDSQYLINELFERRLLTVPERGELMSLLTRPSRLHDRLKHVLESGNESRIVTFCDALIASGQQAMEVRRAIELCKVLQVLRSLSVGLQEKCSSAGEKRIARVPLLCPDSGLRDLMTWFGEKAVFGVTFIDNHLYVVKRRVSVVEVYETICFKLIRNLPIYGLRNPTDIDACRSRKCLYIIGQTNRVCYVFYIFPNPKSSNSDSQRWAVGAAASRLSVSSSGSVLTTCSTERIIKEFTWEGKLIRNMKLHDELANPQHAILLPNDQLIVTHCSRDFSNTIHRVCLVNTTDNALPTHSYGGPQGSADEGRLSSPGHVAVTAEGFILVADLYNDRIAVFDSSLNHVLDIAAAQRGSNSNFDFHLVYTFCLDESRRSLCVAHNARPEKPRHITVYEMSRGTSFARLADVTSDAVG